MVWVPSHSKPLLDQPQSIQLSKDLAFMVPPCKEATFSGNSSYSSLFNTIVKKPHLISGACLLPIIV